MPETLYDRNNHVPAVAPEDDWGDAAAVDVLSSTLPPRRSMPSTQEPQKIFAKLVVVDTSKQAQAEHPEESTSPDSTPLQNDPQPIRLEPAVRVEPSFAKVEKPHVLLAEEAQPSRRRSPDRHWGQSKQFSWRWSLVVTATVILTLIGGFAVLRLVQAHHATPASLAATESWTPTSTFQAPSPMAKIAQILEDRERSWMILEAYAHAKDIEDFLPWTRSTDLTKDQLRAAWRPWNAPSHWSVPFDTSWQPYGLNLPEGGAGVVALGTKHDFSPMRVFLTEENGRVVLDWKATEAYGTATFAELANGQGDGHEVRGYVREETHFSALFPANAYLCHQFFSPDESSAIWIYTERSSPAATKLLKWQAESDSRLLPITLRLLPGPANARPDQWITAETLHNGWIKP